MHEKPLERLTSSNPPCDLLLQGFGLIPANGNNYEYYYADGAGGSGQCDHDMSCGARDTRPRSTALAEVEGGAGDRGATKDTHAGTPRDLRSVAAKRARNYNRANRRRAAEGCVKRKGRSGGEI